MRERLPDADITFHEGPFSAHTDVTDPEAEVLCIFIESPVGETEMSRFPALKLIATRSTGFDHIDLAAAKARGITVVNVPFYGENTVAEFSFALLLALSRRIIEANARVRAGEFSPAGLRGFDLSGKTIGIIGTGHIGAHMIRMAQGFGMTIIAFDAFPNSDLSHTLNFTYVSLPELLAAADILSLHVPYNEHTHHLLNHENMPLIKKGARLINTARGAVIETEALVAALKSGVLAGAALDVLEDEGSLSAEPSLVKNQTASDEELRITVANHFLINHPHVVVTPHVAFNTQEAIERILTCTIENIQRFASGTPINVVTKS